MKPLLFALLLISPPAIALDWDSHPYDKGAHIAISAALSCAVTAKTQNPLYGILAGVLAGAIKEATDTNWDNRDLASWGVGGAIGAICINF